MKQEPVAWMLKDKDWNDACRYTSFPMENAIPLYTAPRELSDDEIYEIWEQFNGEIKNFANAILKKASEK